MGVTFALYRDQTCGAPLWLETRERFGRRERPVCRLPRGYPREGLPVALFSSGEARWLGVQSEGQAEQERILLFSVPYALAAGMPELGRETVIVICAGGDTTGTGNDGLNYININSARLTSPSSTTTINSTDILTKEIEFPKSCRRDVFNRVLHRRT